MEAPESAKLVAVISQQEHCSPGQGGWPSSVEPGPPSALICLVSSSQAARERLLEALPFVLLGCPSYLGFISLGHTRPASGTLLFSF